jgi:DNA-binding IclR family transcriptional regulator
MFCNTVYARTSDLSTEIYRNMNHPVLECETVKAAPRELPGVRVLHKTLDILETIKQSEAGLRLSDVTRSVELPKATVHRILITLEGRGYLDRGEDGAYRVGKKLGDMQRDVPLVQILGRVAKPLMAQLVASSKETVNLGILDAGEVVVIDTEESPQAVRMSSKVGNRRYLHATALGKVLLAGLPEKEIQRLVRVKGMPRVTAQTLTSRPALFAELGRVREQGYAIDNQENEMEGRCIGAPIHGPDGRVVAALSISSPVFRADLAQVRALAPILKETCKAISLAIAK